MTDEAKCTVEALRICHSNKDCRDCKFVESDKDEMSCVNVLFVKSADLIESLFAELEQVKQERDGLSILLGQAQSMLETRTRERDAAVEDLAIHKFCHLCAEDPTAEEVSKCPSCVNKCNWQWRGIQEEHK